MVNANAVMTRAGIVARAASWMRAGRSFGPPSPSMCPGRRPSAGSARYAAMGPAGMTDRSSRPHHSPNRTPQALVRRRVYLRT